MDERRFDDAEPDDPGRRRSFFTAFSGLFEWRDKGERLIEVRSESEAWIPVRWSFFGDTPGLYLDSESDSEPIVELTSASLILADGRVAIEYPPVDPVPDDAEPVAFEGPAAWVSTGSTERSHYWKFHQRPYEVTVANFREDGRAQHRFSLNFTVPKTGARMFGHCEEAGPHRPNLRPPLAERSLGARCVHHGAFRQRGVAAGASGSVGGQGSAERGPLLVGGGFPDVKLEAEHALAGLGQASVQVVGIG
ncbi:MAG: hypothetical protein ACO1SV_22005 [Fimbriimonas sp.]